MNSDATENAKQREAIVAEVMRRHKLVETALGRGRAPLRGISPVIVFLAIAGALCWWFGPKQFMSVGSTPITSLLFLAGCYALFDSSVTTRRINALAQILELSGALSKFQSETANVPGSPAKVPWPIRIDNDT